VPKLNPNGRLFQFEKAAIESKKQITKLEEENSASQTELNDARNKSYKTYLCCIDALTK
jgi:hypothetical protein